MINWGVNWSSDDGTEMGGKCRKWEEMGEKSEITEGTNEGS